METIPGKVLVTAFLNGWCPAQNLVFERASESRGVSIGKNLATSNSGQSFLVTTFGLPPKTDPVIMLVRYVDAIIIPDGESKIAKAGEVSLEGKGIICIQAKHGRLGMYLMGQAFFSERLLQKFKPRTIVSVALCTEDDSTLRPLLESYPSMKVVIIKA